MFRGYLLQNLIEGLGLKVAVLVSCLLYGLVHAANPHAGLLSTAIIVLFGLLRIYGYLATRRPWLSMDMHTGWNFFQGPILGFPASGRASSVTVLRHSTTEPDWLSGGSFGPEASLIAIPVVILALGAIWGWSRSRRLQRR